MNSGFTFNCGLRGGSTGREDFASRSAALPTLSEGLEIELSDFNAEDGTLKCDFLWQVVKIMIGSVPTVPEVHFMCLFMSLGRNQLQGSISTNLFNPMRLPVDIRIVEVGI